MASYFFKSYLFMKETPVWYYWDNAPYLTVFYFFFIKFIQYICCPYLPTRSWKCFLVPKNIKSSFLTSLILYFTLYSWLWNSYAWFLHPISGYGPSYLYERRAYRPSILRKTKIDCNLFNFNIIGYKSLWIHSTFNISCTCMMPTSSCDNNDIKYGSFNFGIYVI